MDIQLPLWAAILAAILTASGGLGGVAGIIAIIRQWQRDKWEGEHEGVRTKVEATSALTNSAISLVNELQERVTKLHDRIEVLEEQREALVCRVKALEKEKQALTADVAILREVVRKRDGRIDELECENKSLKDEVARLEARVKELESKNGGCYGRPVDA